MPGVVHQDVEAAEGLDGRVDQSLRPAEVADVVAVRDGFATHRLDLFDDVRRPGRCLAAAVHLAAEIVDHDLGPVLGEHQGVLATDAPACAGDDAHAPHTCRRVCHCCLPDLK